MGGEGVERGMRVCDEGLEVVEGVLEGLRWRRPVTREELAIWMKMFLGLDVPGRVVC